MGNWRTVNIIGEVPSDEVEALRTACTIGKDFGNFHCLSISDGLAGLGDWVGEHVMARGNLAERDYSVETVAKTLKKLLEAAPNMKLKVHCGSDYESKECIATITVKDGKVTVGEPEVEHVGGASTDEMRGRFYKQLLSRRR